MNEVHYVRVRTGMCKTALLLLAALCLPAYAQTQVNPQVTGEPDQMNAQAVQNSAAGSLNMARGASEMAQDAMVGQGQGVAGPGIPMLPVQGAPQDGINAPAQQLGQQQQQIDATQQRLELMQLQYQVQELAKKMNLAGSVDTEVPMLVGISGARQDQAAEFYSGGVLLTVKPGQWVTPIWKLTRILPNGVVLNGTGGRGAHTLLFGSGSAQPGGSSRTTTGG